MNNSTDMINNLDFITNIALNSSLSEIRAWVKPGNVHRTKNFPKTTYDDFLIASFEILKDWQNLYNNITSCRTSKTSLSQVYSEFLIKASQNMMSVQSGGNVLLGHLLLLGPLFISGVQVLQTENHSRKEFWEINKSIIVNSSCEDTIRLYNAIRIAKPGGMGSVEKYDLYSEKAFDEIKQDNINLQQIFEMSANRDSLSEILSSNYRFIRIDVLPRMEKLFEDYHFSFSKIIKKIPNSIIEKDIIDINRDFNEFIIRIYLFILGSKEDTLILRKNDEKTAKNVSQKSNELYDLFYMMDRTTWFEQLLKFDDELQKMNGKLNPGTSADILAAALFCFYLFTFLK
jgi:triphosphoribosyl-dephospho-CoA synthase